MNDNLYREDYEALVFSDEPVPEKSTEQTQAPSMQETISLTTEDGLNYIFIPLGIFSVDDREYLLVRDFAQEDENIHLLLHTTDENGDDSFETVSGEEFNQVMQDFENFISHISSEKQSMPD